MLSSLRSFFPNCGSNHKLRSLMFACLKIGTWLVGAACGGTLHNTVFCVSNLKCFIEILERWAGLYYRCIVDSMFSGERSWVSVLYLLYIVYIFYQYHTHKYVHKCMTYMYSIPICMRICFPSLCTWVFSDEHTVDYTFAIHNPS